MLLALVLTVNYYRRLFGDGREEYKRKELLRAEIFLIDEFQRLVNPDTVMSYIGIGAGIILGLIFSYMGGIFGAHYESYVFHSAFIPAIYFFGSIYIKDQFFEELPDLAKRFLNNDAAFFVVFALSIAAQSLVTYGLYHAISLFWVMFNVLIIMGLAAYRLYKQEQSNNNLPIPKEVEEDDDY